MTNQHPLTDEMCFSIYIKSTYRPGKWGYMEAMRDTADWQLEQVIEWMRDNLQEHKYSGINILVDYVIEDFREAMRPTNTQENNQ